MKSEKPDQLGGLKEFLDQPSFQNAERFYEQALGILQDIGRDQEIFGESLQVTITLPAYAWVMILYGLGRRAANPGDDPWRREEGLVMGALVQALRSTVRTS